MTKYKKEELKSEAELLYKKASKLIENGQITLPSDFNESFLKLSELTDNEQIELISKLSKNEKLPDIIRNLIDLVQFKQAPFLNKAFAEIYKKIGTYEGDSTQSNLVLTSKQMHTLFQSDRMFSKFLQQVVYGEQDKAEKLFQLYIKQKRDEDIQELICRKGTVTDYSGRTFQNISAYEYAYWAKDTHMCRMLEKYMNEDESTKATMLEYCKAIEKDGLTYTQHKKKITGSKHFDFNPLKNALQDFVKEYGNWYNTENWTSMDASWKKIGVEQCDAPAHVINEYCRIDRPFYPTPKFNDDKLPRVLTFCNLKTNKDEAFFPLVIIGTPNLGFVLSRGSGKTAVGRSEDSEMRATRDLTAISRLNEVRTTDLEQSLDNLKPKEPNLII